MCLLKLKIVYDLTFICILIPSIYPFPLIPESLCCLPPFLSLAASVDFDCFQPIEEGHLLHIVLIGLSTAPYQWGLVLSDSPPAFSLHILWPIRSLTIPLISMTCNDNFPTLHFHLNGESQVGFILRLNYTTPHRTDSWQVDSFFIN